MAFAVERISLPKRLITWSANTVEIDNTATPSRRFTAGRRFVDRPSNLRRKDSPAILIPKSIESQDFQTEVTLFLFSFISFFLSSRSTIRVIVGKSGQSSRRLLERRGSIEISRNIRSDRGESCQRSTWRVELSGAECTTVESSLLDVAREVFHVDFVSEISTLRIC